MILLRSSQRAGLNLARMFRESRARGEYHLATMSRFGTDYQIARATGRCSATGRVLEPGTLCIATLCERPAAAAEEGFERRDFALEAWEAGSRPQGLFSYWKTVVPHPEDKPRLLLDDSVLMDLFERLGGDQRPQRVAFRFVLALILMRKKQLKFTGRETKENTEYWLLQPRGSGSGAGEGGQAPPPIHVANPNLSDEDVRSLIDQLSEVLQSEL